ncbi:unnamed protein product [Linum trigynum]|uniref:Uncharacterized protein n=1 Tax=Linum trigynum TaxID=586398 RepID=A0AAV2DVC9_9ROSI
MQIVEVRSPEQKSRDSIVAITPSTRARPKKSKSGKERVKKTSPTKFNPLKQLQIWSPMKDKRSKSKSRVAPLTLQEITAWTEAKAQRPAEWAAADKLKEIAPGQDEETTSSVPHT